MIVFEKFGNNLVIRHGVFAHQVNLYLLIGKRKDSPAIELVCDRNKRRIGPRLVMTGRKNGLSDRCSDVIAADLMRCDALAGGFASDQEGVMVDG